jgi:hypothetical protein
MKELLPRGAIIQFQLPVFLTSWVDKASPLCMYTVTHIRYWPNAHLKAGCWYIDCGKLFCPVEEEDVQKACFEADSKGAPSGPNQTEVDEVEEVDINTLPAKERNKILAQRARDQKKVDSQALKDLKNAEKAKEKETKASKRGEKSKKSKPSTAPVLLTKASTATESQNTRKQDASVAELSMSRLQQLASPAFMDSAGGVLHFQELVICTSLLSIDEYFVKHNAFPKEWTDMKAFIEKVILFSCLLNVSC